MNDRTAILAIFAILVIFASFAISAILKMHYLRCDSLAERFVVFYEYHRRFISDLFYGSFDQVYFSERV